MTPTGLPADPQLLLLFALPLFGALLLLIAAFTGGGRRKQFRRRVERVRVGSKRPQARAQLVSVKRTVKDSGIPLLDSFIKSALPRREELRKRLDRAGLEISLGTFLAANLGIGLVAAALALWSGAVPPAAAGFVGLGCGLAIPHFGTLLLTKRRQARFIAYFPEAIDLMTRGLKSGLPIVESIKAAGDEVSDPVGSELRRVTDAMRLGRKLDEVLWETSDRLDLQEFKFFTISLSIQSETGGNLTETLSNLSEVLRRRRQLKLKINALSGEAKASAYIIGSLPFVMAGIIYMMNADYLVPLFTDLRGQMMLGVGFLSFFIGGVVMFKMVRFEH